VSSHKNILTFVFEGEKVTEIVNMIEIYILSLKKKKRKEKKILVVKKIELNRFGAPKSLLTALKCIYELRLGIDSSRASLASTSF
jgi:hypothetical protein